MNPQNLTNTGIIRPSDLGHLPQIVQQYLTHTGIVGAPMINTVHLKYVGKFRLGINKAWMTLNADQVYTVNPPGFQWKAVFKRFGFPIMSGQDVYKNGQGRMIGKLGGFFTIFDESDDNLLQGTMMRYLQEMIWFPSAYVNEYIAWKPVDEYSADATFTWGDREVTGRFFFDNMGRLKSFHGMRYNSEKGDYLPWLTPMNEYDTVEKLNLPICGDGIWRYPEGDFTYIHMRLTELHYNISIPEF